MPIFSPGATIDGLIQIGYIVPNIDVAIQHFMAITRAGPWFVIPEFAFEEHLYLGQPTGAKASLAMANCGPIQLELIQPLDNEPSAFRDALKQSALVPHHYCLATSEFDEEFSGYVKQGFEVVTQVVAPGGGRAAYFDTRDKLGVMLELIEDSPMVEGIWRTVRNASIGWNGQEPVRYLQMG